MQIKLKQFEFILIIEKIEPCIYQINWMGFSLNFNFSIVIRSICFEIEWIQMEHYLLSKYN